MSTSKHKLRLRKRYRLFTEQGGKCHWCGRQMAIRSIPGGPLPDDTCTIEHLDSRLSGNRGRFAEERIVAACHGCNSERNRLELLGKPDLTRFCPPTPETIAEATIKQANIDGLLIRLLNGGLHYQARLNKRIIAEWWPSNGRVVVLGRHSEKYYVHDEVLFANVCIVIAERIALNRSREVVTNH